MIPYAVIGDLHIPHTIPQGRTLSFYSEFETKIDYLIATMKDYDITTLITAGDILDSGSESKTIKYLNYARKILDKFKDNGITVYSVAGNHDMPNSSPDLLHLSPYTNLMETGHLTDVNELDGFVGLDYDPDISRLKHKIKELDIKHKKSPVTLILHEHCLPESYSFPYGNFLTYEFLDSPSFPTIICGHLHLGLGVKKVTHTNFINLWSFVRLHRNHYTLDGLHTPELYLSVTGKTHPIPHLPYEKVFIQKVARIQREIKTSYGDFLVKMNSLIGEDGKTNLPVPQEIEKILQKYIG